MRFAIIGCGTAGSRRADAIESVLDASITLCVDTNPERAAECALKHRSDISIDWRNAINRSDVDAVAIATANHLHASIAIAAAEADKHIFCERPIARNASEAEQIIGAARDHHVALQAGLTHRFHSTIRKAHQIIEAGTIGKVITLLGRTGRGGFAVAAPSGWMTDCELSGGGTLLDNGIDLLDICRYFLGDFRYVRGHTAALVWPIVPCEDNAFAILSTADGRTATIHSSWTDWQGYMSFDITGTEGYVKVDYDNGLVIVGSKTGIEETFATPKEFDQSLITEVEELISAAKSNPGPTQSSYDALEALILAQSVYRSAETGGAEII